MKRIFYSLFLLLSCFANCFAGETIYVNVDGVDVLFHWEEVFLTKGPHTIYFWSDYDSKGTCKAYKDVCTRKNPWKQGDPQWYGPIDELGSYGQMIADVDGYYQIFGYQVFGYDHKSEFIVIYPKISGSCGENLTWAFDTVSGNLAIYGSGTMTSHPWENISPALIKSVTLPPALTFICDSAFYNCSALTSVTIPNTVTSIGEWAFNGCSALTKTNYTGDIAAWCDIKFGNSSANPICYSHNCYINDVEIKDLVIPNTVDSIHNYAFHNCSSLTSVTIPTSVTSIGDEAFFNCSALTSVTIPKSVTSIRESAFYWCTSLTSVTIPESVTSIGSSAFGGCSSLTSITCEAITPPTIGENAFYRVSYSIPVYVPCGTVSAYNAAGGWSSFYNIQEPLAEYSIIVSVNETTMGTAKVNYNTFCEGAQISATPNIGYHFVQWNDGNTNAIRSFVLTQDTTFTAEFAPNSYAISTQSSNTERGTTSGDITTTYLDYVTISATANYGYHFSHWNDYNYDNPRQVQVTEDKTYTAYFDKNTYYITKNYDSNQGYVDGYSSGEYLDNITLTAEANYGYHFVQWSDGNTDNPRHFILTQDTTFSAEFAQTFSGQCGDNLYWSYQNNTLTISGFGGMYDNRPWGLFTNEIQTVVLPNGITHIGNDAFSDCTGLNEITIPYTVTSIGDYAFAGCRKLVHVNCYAINPPMAETTSFANYNVYLNVPCDNLQDYQLDMVFGSFKYIQCMEANSENVPTDDVVVTPGTNDVTITWPTAENADTYTIVIQKGNEVFCTLTFNADGQLLNIAFAPSRSGSHPVTYAASTGNGLRFTVTSLEESTTYGYDITTKDEKDNTLSTYTGEFTTKSNVSTSVSDIQSPMTDCQKLIRDGQLIIVRDGKIYNAMGVEM